MIKVICTNCKKEFKRKLSQIKGVKFAYCSLLCRNVHYKICRKGELNPRWKGGYIWRSDKYIDIYAPDHPDANIKGYILEHRLVMEKKINRRLEKYEIVHHKNRIRNDNRPENLEILLQSDHIKEHLPEMMINRERDKLGRWLPK